MTGHQPFVDASPKVTCARTGTLDDPGIGGEPARVPVLADLEAFCARLRELGASGDLRMPLNGDLTVTVGEA